MSKRSRLYPAALSLVLIPLAAAPSLADTSAPTRLAPTLVTATRTAQSVDETLASVTVITREEIAQGQYRDLPQLLNAVPGVQITQSGGMGKITRVSLRGTNNSHVAVLVDGMKIGSATLGDPTLQHLPLDQIERIEIVRGPRSTLYGSEAVGGVIQVFTRKGDAGTGGSMTLGGGSYHTHRGSISFHSGSGATRFAFSVSEAYTGGFDSQKNNVADPGGWGNTPDESDKDGYAQKAITARVSHQFSPGNGVEFHTLRSEGESDYDGWTNESQTIQQVTGLLLTLRPTSQWNLSAKVGQSADRTKEFLNGTFRDRYDSHRTFLNLQNDIALRGSDVLSVGAEYQDDEVRSTTQYDKSSRDNTGYFAQYQMNEGNHTALVGVRREDNEQFGTHTTWNAGYGIALPHDFHLALNYGTSFRAPTFNELYWPADPMWGGGGNPNLEPEKGKSYEVSLRQQLASAYWNIAAYRTEIDNLISGWPAQNVNRAQITGYELGAGYTLTPHWSVSGIVDLLTPEDRGTGKTLIYRAKRSGQFNLNGDFGALRATLSLEGFSERFVDAANTLKLPGYTLAHLRGEYAITPEWSVQAKIENLFDKEYEAIATYNTPGRSAYLSTSYRF
ncbi:TonB-dependent receptor domain-containing protein [Chrysiogenes arsenatis]|uniref:TonB-dependent receptor domain-containing protein n=1 Tax=Chrysiogenes arsenatis TaxID=309797 RepID=UPI00040D3EBD|nr:TonB-dependent receptor [Chrysiogenes arsenatis]